MIYLYQVFFLGLVYFVAAIPFGLIVSKKYAGKDIRNEGSGNIGATNVYRVAGKKLGFITFLLDSLKGALMVIIARYIFVESKYLHLYLCAVSLTAVLAHIYPIYLNYKGGKGVATTLATLTALDPVVGFLSIVFWIMFFLMFRISAVSSIISVFSSIILSCNYDSPKSQLFLCTILLIIIIIRHKENIARIILGEENKL